MSVRKGGRNEGMLKMTQGGEGGGSPDQSKEATSVDRALRLGCTSSRGRQLFQKYRNK